MESILKSYFILYNQHFALVHWHNKYSVITSRPPLFSLNMWAGNKQYTNDGLILLK